MYTIVWRYDVAPEHAAAFRVAYGSDGDWARLFATAPGFVGVELYEGADGAFVTLDLWESEAVFVAFQAAQGEDYAALDRQLAHLTLSQRRIGGFGPG